MHSEESAHFVITMEAPRGCFVCVCLFVFKGLFRFSEALMLFILICSLFATPVSFEDLLVHF